MSISDDLVDGSLPSPPTEILEVQSLVVSSSSLANEIVSPSNLDGFRSISTTEAALDKTIIGSLPSSLTKDRGDHCFNSQLSNSAESSSVIRPITDGEPFVPSNAEQSVVSCNGIESSTSSPANPSPRETLIEKENPSSPPVSWDLLAKERNQRHSDDDENNLVNDEPSSYHPCHCNRYQRIYCPAQQWGQSCGLHCEFNPPFYNPWRSSGGHWGFDQDVRPLSFLLPVSTGVAAGLSNLGNTCFINAILQCFTHTVPFVKALRSSNHLRPCPCRFEGFCVICALRDHIEVSLASSGKIVSPLGVVDNLSYISSYFHRYQQEDAHEFLQCLLDKLERSCVASNLKEETSSLLEDNIVERVFGGRLVSKLWCCNCGHCSDKYEPLIDLSLEIEDMETLESALESFTKVEKIEDNETKFRCGNCKEDVSMEKQLMLDQTPSVAALHLKRFKTDGSSIEKIGKHVQFPLELDLNPFTNSKEDNYEPQVGLKYQLYGIVVHNGFLPTSGHYFSYIRSSPGTWHKLDDSMVIKVEEEMVLSEAAYILFYIRDGTPWFSSLMETQMDCLYPRISNTSPKSVLDNMDGECPAYPNGAVIEGTLTALSCVPVVEEAQINHIWNDSEESSHKNDESSNDVPINDVSVSLEAEATNSCDGMSHNEKFGAVACAEEKIGSGGRINVLDQRSSSADMNFGEQPEARHNIRRDHPKVESSVMKKKMKMDARDPRMEALRCMKNMPASRHAKLFAAMQPRNGQERRLKSSPCKLGSAPGLRSKVRGRAIFR